ncbi:hypothetical protein [Hyphomicrobium sp.]|uniref:hypothetical protein n=1 Tax=Hyphomicrobium sp. TaxID=82 RepID=UPI0025C18F65|nr:hypothetical protein [Hyphomicrobium sp.]
MRFFELYVVLTFAAAWGVLELVARRLDKSKAETGEPPSKQPSCAGDNRPEIDQ